MRKEIYSVKCPKQVQFGDILKNTRGGSWKIWWWIANRHEALWQRLF